MAIAAAVLVALGVAHGCERPAPSSQAARTPASISIQGQRVALEVADTAEAQSVGLGYRDALPWDHGMLFLYDQPGFPRFWMKGMRFDIDIVWIRGNRIVEISHRVPHTPGGNGPTVQPGELTDIVLEVPAGYAQSHGWHVGGLVVYEPAAR